MIGAVLLAAGESTRMGEPKPLLPFGDTTLIEHLARELLDSDVDCVVAVLGHEAERVRKRLLRMPVRVAVNADYKQGMLSSIRCGLRALPDAAEAALIAPVDQPRLSSDIVETLIRAWRCSGKGMAVPIHDGRRGHPLLIAARYFPEVLTGLDDTGLRGLLRRYPDDLLQVPFDDPAVLGDADTPEDYRRQLNDKV